MDSRGKNQSFSVVGFQYEPENPDNQKNGRYGGSTIDESRLGHP